MAAAVMQASGHGHSQNKHKSTVSTFLKRCKARLERRKARRDPETTPGYGRFRGYAD
jgi:hypothetical protein